MTKVPQRFDILLFDAFSNHCLANTVEPLRAANTVARKKLYEWRFVTLDGAAVVSSSGMEIAPQIALPEGRGDMLVVMPSYDFEKADTPATTRALLAARPRYQTIAGFDTGSWLLARAGFLDGHPATIHWEELSRFEEAFPEVDAQRQRFVTESPCPTCSGAMAAFDLILKMIAETHGPLITMEVAQIFMSDSFARAHVPNPRGSTRMVDRVLQLMQENLETPIPIDRIAKDMGVSQKLLETRMKDAMQATPQAVYQRLRLNLAYKLVTETDQSVSEIASRSGYENASAMTRAFKSRFHGTPRDLRRSQNN